MRSATAFLFSFADILILALVVALLTHMLLRQKNALLASTSELAIVSVGILLIAIVQALEFFAAQPATARATLLGSPTRIPEWIFWVSTRSGILLIVAGLFIARLQRRKIEIAIDASSHIQRAAENQAIQSEERFRGLFETTSNAVCCYTFDPAMDISLPLEEQIRRSDDALLTECNDVFAGEVGYEKPSEIIGTRMSLLDSNKDRTSHARFIEDLIASNYRLTDYELVFSDANANDRAISISVSGIVKDGRLERLWCVERNILDVRRTNKALYRRRIFQEMISGVSTRLVVARLEDADETMMNSLREVCEYLGGNRIFLVWSDAERRTGEIVYAWQSDDRPLLEDIRMELFPYLGSKMLKNEPICVPDISELPDEANAEKKILFSAGIKSFLISPLIIAGESVGFTGVANDVMICDWTEQDLLDLRVFSELFSTYVLRLRQRRDLDNALLELEQATERLEAENVYLRSEIKLNNDFEYIVGDSEALRRCLRLVEQVADTVTPVLILGETGTGKELVARALHEHSSRRFRPLVKVNCAALPANLIESELFGYKKGAFTSADSSKRGRFDLAHGSTIFLDEIGDFPVELQAKLLRVLQEGEFERLGGGNTKKVDVRIIAATNRDLGQACNSGAFRPDLYYRINTFPIELPPLRERGSDIRLLAEHFVDQHSQRLGREITGISANMMQQLEAYDWPGNVRELESVIQRALITGSGPVLELGQGLKGRGVNISRSENNTTGYDLQSIEREYIVAILEQSEWKISGSRGAAFTLGLPASTLRSKMKKLGILRPH